MAKWQYTKGVHDLGNGLYAWLQPDGTWGYSNSGLIADGDKTLLVDTLFDLKLTREMLDGYRKATPKAAKVDVLVNTHSNGDHTFGNQLVTGARIIASKNCATEMSERRPEDRSKIAREWQQNGAMGQWIHDIYGGKFDFEGITYTPPTETFEREMTLHVGAKEVRLVEVGPAHTRGDVLVHVPSERTAFTGDILFNGGHPAIWAGPVANWIKACDTILSWDVDTVVPGHGPITDKTGVRAMKKYFEYISAETRKRYDAGLSEEDTVSEILLDGFDGWTDAERIVINVNALYREYSGGTLKTDQQVLYARLAKYRAEHLARQTHVHGDGCGCGHEH